MEGLGDIVEAADSAWAITAIALLGIFALLWKYGGEILKLTRENAEVAKVNAEVTQGVAESIVTNHGSRNLGDAIDRLTEWMLQHMEDSARTEAELSIISAKLGKHLAEYDQYVEARAAARGKNKE